MKKFLKTVLFLCAIASLAYAEETTTIMAEDNVGMRAEEQKEAMKILEKMREKIEKEEAEKAKLAKEARELEVQTNDITSVEEVKAMVEAKKVEEAKPKTEAEKLERTRKKAMDKLDFYERVVRSVAREENEISDYYGIMGEEKQKSGVMLETETTAKEEK